MTENTDVERWRFHHAPWGDDSWCSCPGCGSTSVDVVIRRTGDGTLDTKASFECEDCGRTSPEEAAFKEEPDE